MHIEQKQAEEAVRTLLRWIGEDPDRAELRTVPKRSVEKLADYFAGRQQDPIALLQASRIETDTSYDKQGMIVFPEIPFTFYCEHSLTLTIGTVRIAYLPQQYIIGLGAMPRLVTLLSKRLQLQEQFTAQLGAAIDDALKPLGVAIMVEARHYCADGISLKTHYYSGCFEQTPALRQEFLS